jgi:hypothetical protein
VVGPKTLSSIVFMEISTEPKEILIKKAIKKSTPNRR